MFSITLPLSMRVMTTCTGRRGPRNHHVYFFLSFFPTCMYSLAVITDHPNSVAYCDQNTRAHSPGGQKSEIQVLQGHGPFEGSREASLSCLFQPLVGPGIIPQPALCLRPPREPPPPPQCLRVAFPSLFLREVLMTAFHFCTTK